VAPRLMPIVAPRILRGPWAVHPVVRCNKDAAAQAVQETGDIQLQPFLPQGGPRGEALEWREAFAASPQAMRRLVSVATRQHREPGISGSSRSRYHISIM